MFVLQNIVSFCGGYCGHAVKSIRYFYIFKRWNIFYGNAFAGELKEIANSKNNFIPIPDRLLRQNHSSFVIPLYNLPTLTSGCPFPVSVIELLVPTYTPFGHNVFIAFLCNNVCAYDGSSFFFFLRDQIFTHYLLKNYYFFNTDIINSFKIKTFSEQMASKSKITNLK